MSEFKLHHLVRELLELLRSKSTPEEYVECLQKSISANKLGSSISHIAIQSEVQNLAIKSLNQQAFLGKYEDLKQKNVDCLGSFVQLLHLISQDVGVKDFLSRTVKSNTVSAESCTKVMFTRDELPQVKNRLKKAVTKKSINIIDSNTSRLLNRSGPPMPSTPSVTSWVQRRPSMSWDFSTTSCLTVTTQISSIPSTSQESLLIEDLLNVLMGLPGCYIEPLELKGPHDVREFSINECVDPSLKELVKQILPLASYYSIVQRFTEEKMRFEFGQVNNALAECMSAIIVEYTLFVTQLETESRSGNLNLHKMWYYIQSNMHSLSIVCDIATRVNKSDAVGGKVLSLLHDQISAYIGDYKAQDLCVHLMQAASVPYMKMLGMWIYKGIISDPIDEFLVEDQEVVQKEDMPVDYSADYWDKKYIIRRERIPKFLEPVADIILRAGKYLNVIRQCGRTLNHKVETIEYKLEERNYIEAIENAYKYASQTLLDLVMKDQDLLGRLKSVKHYFLLDQGNFIVTFLALCEKELSKNINDVIQARLDSLLDLALRLSCSCSDPYKDDLRTELLPYDLQFQMFKILSIQTMAEPDYWSNGECSNLSVIQTFTFSYEVRWPLSLILNRKSLACYQMIFRHLFYCKYVERMICQVWRSNKVTKKFPFHAAKQYRNAFALRQRMLHCVQNLEYHMMVEVIEPHWCTFVQKISKGDVGFQGDTHEYEGNNVQSFEDSISKLDIEFTSALMQLLDQINDMNRGTSDYERLFNLLYR
ncbi:gamma tubulin complex protein [Holotrichia oblita]|uniref:Gamma tubulin complex protein n=1 Tax=Holotrichia oblita TaxID=644536 RepID=A0ACB9T7Q0_HOLOL|nr:gamma tubulin complex protein [Holotrichia oblita]